MAKMYVDTHFCRKAGSLESSVMFYDATLRYVLTGIRLPEEPTHSNCKLFVPLGYLKYTLTPKRLLGTPVKFLNNAII